MNWEMIGLGALGGFAALIVLIIDGARNARAAIPKNENGSRKLFWFYILVVLPFLGALFVFLHLLEGATFTVFLSIHVGASAPLFFKYIAHSLPTQDTPVA